MGDVNGTFLGLLLAVIKLKSNDCLRRSRAGQSYNFDEANLLAGYFLISVCENEIS